MEKVIYLKTEKYQKKVRPTTFPNKEDKHVPIHIQYATNPTI